MVRVRGIGKLNQYKKILCYLLIVLFVLAAGWKLYNVCFRQKIVTAYTADQRKAYLNYESRMDSASCYNTNKFTEEQLFGDSGFMIAYARVKETKSIVCQEKDNSGNQNKYNAYLAKLEIKNAIYGDLKQRKEYWVFLGIKYTSSSLKKEDEGVFVIQDEPLTLWFPTSKESIKTCGMIYRNLDYSYLLAGENQGLEELKDKEDVINYWKEHDFLEGDS